MRRSRTHPFTNIFASRSHYRVSDQLIQYNFMCRFERALRFPQKIGHAKCHCKPTLLEYDLFMCARCVRNHFGHCCRLDWALVWRCVQVFSTSSIRFFFGSASLYALLQVIQFDIEYSDWFLKLEVSWSRVDCDLRLLWQIRIHLGVRLDHLSDKSNWLNFGEQFRRAIWQLIRMWRPKILSYNQPQARLCSQRLQIHRKLVIKTK